MKLEDYINHSKNPTFNEAYLKLVEVVKNYIPQGFEWGFGSGMPGYDVPLAIYPHGYHVTPETPLPFLGLAIQKNHIAIYHMGIYLDDELLKWFIEAYEQLKIGKLDMGKSCIRIKNPNKLPFDLIGELVSKMTIDDYIRKYEASLSTSTSRVKNWLSV